ncbi:dynein regulatory complex protein 9 [Salarias fasciatus]|uniref:dynein regulatory complex protein 9 n=1 Tax=Salarias fasciatus TaxID=181472 RepID=UPI001176862D|nr:dynein regulatory complex protein 9 [Salarias fasciatus]
MSLPHTQSLRSAAVVEDCVLQLDILGHALEVQISRQKGPAAAQEKARLSKMKKDCESISLQMSKLHLELEEKHSFDSLRNVVDKKEQHKKDEEKKRELMEELEQRRKHLLEKEAEEQARKVSEKLSASSRQKGQSLESKQDLKKNIELQLLAEEKATARAEELLQDQLDLLYKKLKEEMTVHEESEKFLQDQHEELQQQLQKWQQLTKQIQQEKKEQLISVWGKKTLGFNRLMETKGRFRVMEQVVMEDREEQEKLRQQHAKVRAATKLQAWWRGCMVRRGLGGFKTDASKKGKKKEGKKKKK